MRKLKDRITLADKDIVYGNGSEPKPFKKCVDCGKNISSFAKRCNTCLPKWLKEYKRIIYEKDKKSSLFYKEKMI